MSQSSQTERPLASPAVFRWLRRGGPTSYFTWAFTLATLAVTHPALSPLLHFDRKAIAQGEIWRLLTGHFTHWSASHLYWDLSVFVALGCFCERRSRRQFLGCVFGSGMLISGTVWLLLPQLATYRGLSGLDSALFVLFAIHLIRDFRAEAQWCAAMAVGTLLLALAAKIGFELTTGKTLFVDANAAGFLPVPLAHLAGAAAGLVAISFDKFVGQLAFEALSCHDRALGSSLLRRRFQGMFSRRTRQSID